MSALSLVARTMPSRLFVPMMAMQYRLCEPELRRLDDFVPANRGAVDIGAWWGPWSWWLARRCPRVHAFEPNNAIVAELSKAMPGNVELHNTALSNCRVTTDLWCPPGGRGTEGRSSMTRARQPGWTSQTVDAIPLDDLVLSDIGFIKVDVEGHEVEVLEGASDTIDRNRPAVLVEVEEAHLGSRDAMDSAFSYFSDRGYSGSYLSEGAWHSLAQFDRGEARKAGLRSASTTLLHNVLTRGDGYIHNFLFAPTAP